jgi:aldehyde:ferredoxin oxidoreductase
MGSKRIKEIAVMGSRLPKPPVRKTPRIEPLDAPELQEKSKQWHYGTSADMCSLEANGNLLIRNFQRGRFLGVKKIGLPVPCEKYPGKMDHCYGYPIRCKRVVKMQGFFFSGRPGAGRPEYETLAAAFGSNWGIDDQEAMMKTNVPCASIPLTRKKVFHILPKKKSFYQ